MKIPRTYSSPTIIINTILIIVIIIDTVIVIVIVVIMINIVIVITITIILMSRFHVVGKACRLSDLGVLWPTAWVKGLGFRVPRDSKPKEYTSNRIRDPMFKERQIA